MTSFAEIIESSLSKFKAQTWKWDNFPEYGSLITITNNATKIFAIVYNIETGSIDPTRTPFAYQKTEEELLKEQPHIFEFLTTNFSCLSLGYSENIDTSNIIYQIAPKPPKIHSFVSYATKAEVKLFFSNPQFLQLIFNYKNQLGSIDELLLAILKKLTDNDMLNYYQLSNFIETINILTGNDYRLLKLFLQRVQPIIEKSIIKQEITKLEY